MKESRLISILSNLSPIERRSLGKFLRSPYFNKRVDLIKLFEYLVTQITREKDLAKESIFKAVFPNRKFDDTNLRLLMSYLVKLVERFLVVESIDTDPSFQKKQLMVDFRKRGLQKLYQKARKQVSEINDASQLRHSNYYETRYEVLMESFHDDAVQQLKETFPLQEFADQLDITFIIKKLQQTCLLLNQRSVVKTEVEIGMLDEVLCHIKEKKELLSITTVATYYYGYLTLIEQVDKSHFFEFKKLVLKNPEKFLSEQLQELHLLAINYCIRKLNGGDHSFFVELLDLYKEGLRTETLLQGKRLSRFTYHNIVATAIKSDELDWASDFVTEYKPLLDKKFRESSFSYNLARLSYAKGDYETAIPLLQKANYRDVLLNLAAKTLALKIYYEKDEIEVLQSHIEAMKSYIRRKRVIGYHKTNYLNILQMTQKLLQLNIFDRVAKKQFLEDVKLTEPLTEKEWFGRVVKN